MISTSHRPRRIVVLVACAALFAVVACVRLYYVESFAMSLPFWDQWDSEGNLLLRQWINGTLPISRLWETHNEHRIMMSRLLTLALYSATGSWDNLVSARFNVVLSALWGATLLWLLLRDGALHGARWLVLPVLLAGLVLPFSWENFLVGFQSQFYLVILFTLVSIALAAYRPDDRRAQVAMMVIAVACCFTLASGILTPLATIVVLQLHGWCARARSAGRDLLSLLLLAVALIGYGTTPRLEYHEKLRAEGLVELVDSTSHMLGWPVSGYHWAAPLLWAPGIIGVLLILRYRDASRSDLLMAGLLAWSALQAAAAAYSRGHGMIDPSSRYLDLLVPGLVANAWFAVRLLERARGNKMATAGAMLVGFGFSGAFLFGHVNRFDDDWAAMEHRHALSVIQTRNVISYIATGDLSNLDQPYLQIPYPDRLRLKMYLDDPYLRGALQRGHALDDPDTGEPALPRPPAASN